MIRLPTRPTLFPYTTLFRSQLFLAVLAFAARGDFADALLHFTRRFIRERHRQNIFRRNAARNHVRRSEEHTSELQSRLHLVCRLLLEKKKKTLILLILYSLL